jgi:hypothetical protein
MTSNTTRITEITELVGLLVGRYVTVRNQPARSIGNPRIVESGTCTAVLISYFSESREFSVHIAVEELKTEIHYPRGGYVETVSEGRHTEYIFPLEKLLFIEPGFRGVTMRFEAPSADYLTGSTQLLFTRLQ